MNHTAVSLLLLSALACFAAGCASPSKPLPPRLQEAAGYTEKAAAAFQAGCEAEAETLIRTALELNRSVDHRKGVAENLESLAVLLASQSRWEDAFRLLDEAETVHREEQHRESLFYNRLNRCRFYIQAGQLSHARRELERLQEESIPTRRIEASWLVVDGVLHLEEERYEEALSRFEHALKRLPPSEDPRAAASVYYHLARTYQGMGRTSEAMNRALEALAMDKAEGRTSGIGEDLLLLADLAQTMGREVQARDFRERAFYVFFYLGNAERVQSLVRSLEASQDHEVMERLHPYLERLESQGLQPLCP